MQADQPQLLDQIRRLLDQQRRLWTIADVAEYLQLSVDHVRDRVVHSPGFPAAARIGHAKRWKPEDVRAWVEMRKRAA